MLGFSSKKSIIILVALVILIAAVASGYAGIIPSAVTAVSAPVFRVTGNFTSVVVNWFSNIINLADQVKKTAELQREVNRLQAELALAEFSKVENEQLRAILNLKATSEYEILAASAVTEDPTRSASLVILNKGSEDKVESGSAVLNVDGQLLGVVTEVGLKTSKFLLLIDRNSRVDVVVVPHNFLGVAKGSHGVGIELDFLPQESSIKPGDTVVTAGLTQRLPPGIPVGSVDEILSSPADLFKKVSLVSFADMRDFRVVGIIIGNKE